MNRRTFLETTAAALAPLHLAQAAPAGKIITSVMLWTLKGTFTERLEVAAKAGCQSVELVGEHVEWTDAQIAENKKLVRGMGLAMDTVIATPNWKKRPVSMVRPEQRDNFLADVRQAIDFARKLEVPQIILMSGDQVPGASYESQWASLVEGTKRAGDLAAKAGVTLIFEPLNNKVNHADYFLPTCGEGLRLVREVNNPHVRLLFDIYHEQVQIGNVIRTLREAAPHVAVFHFADNPGRNDPGTGELSYPNIYKAIRETGYSGYATMEYLPLGDPLTSLTKAVNDMKSVLVS